MCKGFCIYDKENRCKLRPARSDLVYFISCDTPWSGRPWGAGRPGRSSAARRLVNSGRIIGAAAGAAAGALTGAIIQENQAARYGPPPAGWLSIRALGRDAGLYYRPYTGRIYDLRGVHPVTYARRRYRPAFPQTVIDY